METCIYTVGKTYPWKEATHKFPQNLERWEIMTLEREDLDDPEDVTIESGDPPEKMSAWKAKFYLVMCTLFHQLPATVIK